MSSASVRRAYGRLIPDIASMGWWSGRDPHRQEACLAGTISPLPARIPSQRSKDLRFVVVPDDQRPCRSPKSFCTESSSAIDQMLRRYEDRRSEFRHRFPKSGLRHRSSVPSSMPAPRGHPRLSRPCGPKLQMSCAPPRQTPEQHVSDAAACSRPRLSTGHSSRNSMASMTHSIFRRTKPSSLTKIGCVNVPLSIATSLLTMERRALSEPVERDGLVPLAPDECSRYRTISEAPIFASR